MLSYSHHKKEIKNLSYDGLFLYFWKQEVWDDHKKNGIQEGDYSAKRGVEKAVKYLSWYNNLNIFHTNRSIRGTISHRQTGFLEYSYNKRGWTNRYVQDENR